VTDSPRARIVLPLVLATVFIAAGLWGYRDWRAEKLGPPLGKIKGQDFNNVLHAAHNLEIGANLYGYAEQFLRTPSFKEFTSWEETFYIYPPLFAALVRPLLRLPPPVALTLWGLGNYLVLLCAAAFAVREFAPPGLPRVPAFACLAVVFTCYYPCQLELKIGQVDIVLLLLLLVTYRLYCARSRVAGLPLACALSIKPVLAPLLVFFVWKREWRTAATAAGAAAVLVAGSFTLAGWHQLPSYLSAHHFWATGPMLVFPVNQSVTAVARRVFTVNVYSEPVAVCPWLASLLPLIVAALAGAGWLAVVPRDDNRNHAVNGIEFGATLTTQMLISPITEDIHFVWVLVPLAALLLAALGHTKLPRDWMRLAVVVGLLLYFGLPDTQATTYTDWTAAAFTGTLVPRAHVLYTGMFLYGLVILDVWLLLQCIRWRRLSQPGA